MNFEFSSSQLCLRSKNDNNNLISSRVDQFSQRCRAIQRKSNPQSTLQNTARTD